jgi:hypothetical protein
VVGLRRARTRERLWTVEVVGSSVVACIVFVVAATAVSTDFAMSKPANVGRSRYGLW